MELKKSGSVAYVYNYPAEKHSPKRIVAFDLDGTLIQYNTDIQGYVHCVEVADVAPCPYALLVSFI